MVGRISNVEISDRIDAHAAWSVEGHGSDRFASVRAGGKSLDTVVSRVHHVSDRERDVRSKERRIEGIYMKLFASMAMAVGELSRTAVEPTVPVVPAMTVPDDAPAKREGVALVFRRRGGGESSSHPSSISPRDDSLDRRRKRIEHCRHGHPTDCSVE